VLTARRWSVAALFLGIALQGELRGQTPVTRADLTKALSDLMAAALAPQDPRARERTPFIQKSVQWLAGQSSRTNPADVSPEYLRSLQRAAELLQQNPDIRTVTDIEADLEAKIDHCRRLGIGMGGLVTLRVNTLRDGKPVGNWRVHALLKFFERTKGAESRTSLRVSSPVDMPLEPGRYLVWAVDEATGRMTRRLPVTVAGQNELVYDLTLP
jgi:hypothetical protein